MEWVCIYVSRQEVWWVSEEAMIRWAVLQDCRLCFKVSFRSMY